MTESIKKKFSLFLLAITISCGMISCKGEHEDLIIDYYPVEFEILVVNTDGENLLDESTPMNILDSEMYVELAGEKYEVQYGRPEDPFFPHPALTRAYMPSWYGAFIAPYWYHYPDLPERGNRLYIGEFPGDIKGEVKFELNLDGHSYNISYINKKFSGLNVEREFYLDGKKIPSSSFTLTL